MDNKDLNENEFNGIISFDAEEITKNDEENSTEVNSEAVEENVEENVSDLSDENKDGYDLVFDENITDDLLSEIFDDDNPKSKKKNKAVKTEKTEKAPKSKKPTKKKVEMKKTFLSELFDWVEIIVLSAAFVLVLFTFVMRLAVVDGPSMENTLHDDEMLIISGLFYTPENNDIIVFNSPNFKEPIVKRVIATAGQTVDIDFENWKVTVDGKVLDEPYVKKTYDFMKASDVGFPLTVPEGYVFVMGDNRNDSLDSRSSLIGLVDERYILGEVKMRLFPFNKFGIVD